MNNKAIRWLSKLDLGNWIVKLLSLVPIICSLKILVDDSDDRVFGIFGIICLLYWALIVIFRGKGARNILKGAGLSKLLLILLHSASAFMCFVFACALTLGAPVHVSLRLLLWGVASFLLYLAFSDEVEEEDWE